VIKRCNHYSLAVENINNRQKGANFLKPRKPAILLGELKENATFSRLV